MAAPKGNRFWEARSSHGANPKYENAEQLWDACCQYFEWIEENPLFETQAFAYQGEVTQEAIPKMRAMTISGLCRYIGISQETWGEYRERKDLSEVAARADEIIRDQKFSGAAAGLLNPNIIARDLGLRDATDSKHTVSVTDLSEDELDRRLAQLTQQEAEG